MNEVKHKRNNPTSKAASLEPSYADLVGTTFSSTNVIQTLPSAERLEKLEYTSSEEERRGKLF